MPQRARGHDRRARRRPRDRPAVRGGAGALRPDAGPAGTSPCAAGALLPAGAAARRRPVHAVGKVADLFAGVGIDVAHHGADNETGDRGDDAPRCASSTPGSCSRTSSRPTSVYGHRKDVEGFHQALRRIDAAVAEWLGLLDPERDLLVLTADHGVDPKHARDRPHARARPLLARFAGHGGRRHDGPMADVGASCLRWLAGGEADLPGEPFVP